uniref:SCP domain-containing protein n=1 Tax=Macrostomum lignano TaxID=282301 RepID=A0A1I8HF53_9PLAT
GLFCGRHFLEPAALRCLPARETRVAKKRLAGPALSAHMVGAPPRCQQTWGQVSCTAPMASSFFAFSAFLRSQNPTACGRRPQPLHTNFAFLAERKPREADDAGPSRSRPGDGMRALRSGLKLQLEQPLSPRRPPVGLRRAGATWHRPGGQRVSQGAVNRPEGAGDPINNGRSSGRGGSAPRGSGDKTCGSRAVSCCQRLSGNHCNTGTSTATLENCFFAPHRSRRLKMKRIYFWGNANSVSGQSWPLPRLLLASRRAVSSRKWYSVPVLCSRCCCPPSSSPWRRFRSQRRSSSCCSSRSRTCLTRSALPPPPASAAPASLETSLATRSSCRAGPCECDSATETRTTRWSNRLYTCCFCSGPVLTRRLPPLGSLETLAPLPAGIQRGPQPSGAASAGGGAACTERRSRAGGPASSTEPSLRASRTEPLMPYLRAGATPMLESRTWQTTASTSRSGSVGGLALKNRHWNSCMLAICACWAARCRSFMRQHCASSSWLGSSASSASESPNAASRQRCTRMAPVLKYSALDMACVARVRRMRFTSGSAGSTQLSSDSASCRWVRSGSANLACTSTPSSSSPPQAIRLALMVLATPTNRLTASRSWAKRRRSRSRSRLSSGASSGMSGTAVSMASPSWIRWAISMMNWLSLLILLLPSCCWGQLTDAEKQEGLQFTNHLRRNVVPRAGDMNGVLWDDNLAQLAQSAADKCIFQHNYDGPYAGLGENVYKGARRNLSEIFMFMFLERENFNFKTSSCNINSGSKYSMFTTCGHYLQLVSANVMRMGCGLKQCPDGNNLVFCEYNKGVMNPPYEAGEPGTKCRHLMASYSQNGLCYYKGIGEPAPISGQLDCKITCLNYGNRTDDGIQCKCTCPLGFYGMRCELKTGATPNVPNDCTAQLVQCKNGGTPTMNGDNIAQADNSVFWYFGETMLYSSYYPVDPQIPAARTEAALQAATTLLGYGDLLLTDNYPQNALDGSLKIGVHYRMQDATASTCGVAKALARLESMQSRTSGMSLALPILLLLSVAEPGSCGMTDALRREALEAHNYLRRNVYPEAVGMARLEWSPALEALAERAAQTCVFEHNTGGDYAGKGENMYLGGKDNFTEILTLMFLERELYDFENSRCLVGTGEYQGAYGFFRTCGHYLQIVRADMTQVGCSINSCRGADGAVNNLAVCEYESMYKEPPYRAKKPGEDPCELCGYDGYATACEDGMCTVLDSESPVRSAVQRRCLNCGQMQYYGPYDFCMCEDNFYGDVCEKRIQSALPRAFVQSCNKCQQENIRCECICRDGFTGEYCEVDLEEDANTLELYIGGAKRYSSYYPVDKAIWNAAERGFLRDMQSALANYCTRGRPRVRLSANYPATTIDGSLKVGLHAKCGRQYIDKAQLTQAYEESRELVGQSLDRLGVAVRVVHINAADRVDAEHQVRLAQVPPLGHLLRVHLPRLVLSDRRQLGQLLGRELPDSQAVLNQQRLSLRLQVAHGAQRPHEVAVRVLAVRRPGVDSNHEPLAGQSGSLAGCYADLGHAAVPGHSEDSFGRAGVLAGAVSGGLHRAHVVAPVALRDAHHAAVGAAAESAVCCSPSTGWAQEALGSSWTHTMSPCTARFRSRCPTIRISPLGLGIDQGFLVAAEWGVLSEFPGDEQGKHRPGGLQLKHLRAAAQRNHSGVLAGLAADVQAALQKLAGLHAGLQALGRQVLRRLKDLRHLRLVAMETGYVVRHAEHVHTALVFGLAGLHRPVRHQHDGDLARPDISKQQSHRIVQVLGVPAGGAPVQAGSVLVLGLAGPPVAPALGLELVVEQGGALPGIAQLRLDPVVQPPAAGALDVVQAGEGQQDALHLGQLEQLPVGAGSGAVGQDVVSQGGGQAGAAVRRRLASPPAQLGAAGHVRPEVHLADQTDAAAAVQTQQNVLVGPLGGHQHRGVSAQTGTGHGCGFNELSSATATA